jgi:hypothetical protein
MPVFGTKQLFEAIQQKLTAIKGKFGGVSSEQVNDSNDGGRIEMRLIRLDGEEVEIIVYPDVPMLNQRASCYISGLSEGVWRGCDGEMRYGNL